MEKVIWVRSTVKKLGTNENDGLSVVNEHLEKGWKVKHISACAAGVNLSEGQAYVVLEKDID